MKRKLMINFSFCLLCFLFVFSTNCFADRWLDSVISFDRPEGSSSEGGPASDALGANNSTYVSIDIPETLILAFTDNEVFDGAGNDLYIYEVDNGDSWIDVWASADNISYTNLGQIKINYGFDLSAYGLTTVQYLKFVGVDNGGGSAGFDLDAVEALHSRDITTGLPEPASMLLLGFGLAGLAWARRKIKK